MAKMSGLSNDFCNIWNIPYNDLNMSIQLVHSETTWNLALVCLFS